MVYRIIHKSGVPVFTGTLGRLLIACMPRCYPDPVEGLAKVVSKNKNGGRLYTDKVAAEKFMNVLNRTRFKDEFHLEER